jgi:hypothetical protein
MLTTLKNLADSSNLVSLPKLSGHEVCNPSVLLIGDGRFLVSHKGVNYNLGKGGYFGDRTYAGMKAAFSDAQNYFSVLEWVGTLGIRNIGFFGGRHIRSDTRALAGPQDLCLFIWRNKIFAIATAISYKFEETKHRYKKARERCFAL